MIILCEFLDNDPIENVITCRNFKIDKVIYFGYEEVIRKQQAATETFLKKHCGVETVLFIEVQKELQSIIRIMSKRIAKEQRQGAELYFDVTGGESLILVAFGMLSNRFETPMHYYDVSENQIHELNEGAKRSITERVERQLVPIDIDSYIALMGGSINYVMQKNYKEADDPEYKGDSEKLLKIFRKYRGIWNSFSAIIKDSRLVTKNNLCTVFEKPDVEECLENHRSGLRSLGTLINILQTLYSAGILCEFKILGNTVQFQYKNSYCRNYITDGGALLELYVYLKEREISDDCRMGVHIDWDGVIHSDSTDVINELDVLSVSGNILTVISCKSGKMNCGAILTALYELDTVAEQIGGKYIRKVLYVTQKVSRNYALRAKEMGIEIRRYTGE